MASGSGLHIDVRGHQKITRLPHHLQVWTRMHPAAFAEHRGLAQRPRASQPDRDFVWRLVLVMMVLLGLLGPSDSVRCLGIPDETHRAGAQGAQPGAEVTDFARWFGHRWSSRSAPSSEAPLLQ